MQAPLVRYQLAVSLDGFIGPHDGSVEWLEPYGPVAEEVMTPFMEGIGGIVMGRLTYETAERLGGWPFWKLPTCVLASQVDYPAREGVLVTNQGPRAALDQTRARMQGGDIWLVGGGQTATSFLEEGLLDRVELTSVPVLLGDGKPLFPGLRQPATLELLSSRTGSGGTQITVYSKLSAGTPGG